MLPEYSWLVDPAIGKVNLEKLKRRDPEALTAAIEEHAGFLYRASLGMGFNDTEAEDLVQDVFRVFLESLDRFEGRSHLRTWLFGILHRKAMERRREQYREEQHDSIDSVFESRFDRKGRWLRPPQDLDQLFASQEIGHSITHCLEGLPASQREVFILREMEELETQEICKILEVSLTNMSVLLHRAKIRLRECLEALGWGKA